jgi:threonine/homoserine/homoserine lactone efflux protein
MPSECRLARLLFAFVMAILPASDNVMPMACGARFGPRRTNPHCLGVALGFGAMFFAIELDAGVALASSRVPGEAMRWASIAFLDRIAGSIATGPVRAAGAADGDGAAGTCVPQDAGKGLVVSMSAALAAITWVSAGARKIAGRALRASGRRLAFNLAMAVLRVASVEPALRDDP